MELTTKELKKLKTGNLKKAENNLVKWLHLYIRLRDLKKENGRIYGRCISCFKELEVKLFSDGSIYNGRELHAGHYFKSHQYASVKYDEDNIHLQCSRCNRQLHGNESQYQINLIKKIGEENFEMLKKRSKLVKKFNILEIEELIKTYKNKAKAEAERLQIKI